MIRLNTKDDVDIRSVSLQLNCCENNSGTGMTLLEAV